MTIKRKSDFLSNEKRTLVINELITYFNSERNEEIGIIAAEDIVNFFLQSCGEDIYAKGVQHARIVLRENLDHLETDLEQLSGTRSHKKII